MLKPRSASAVKLFDFARRPVLIRIPKSTVLSSCHPLDYRPMTALQLLIYNTITEE
jgi:hypothetical protein